MSTRYSHRSNVQSNAQTRSDVPLPQPELSETRDRASVAFGRTLSSSVLIATLTALAIFLCAAKLDAFSIRDWDESLHVLAVQNMFQHNDWLTPIVEGDAYFSKPPLKMWLSAASLYFLPNSNAGWRALDAAAGVGTTLIVYFFAIALFRNRLAGFLGSLALLSSKGFLFEHSVRMAVQDSAMVFFTTAGLYAGWHALQFTSVPSSRGSSRERVFSASTIVAGVLFAAALLTKSVQGSFGLWVLVASVVAGLRLPLLTQQRFQLQRLAAIALIAVSIASLYMLPHCLLTPGACETFFGREVWERFSEGYHNSNNPWLYWELLVYRMYALHPVTLAVLSLLASLAMLSSGIAAFLSIAGSFKNKVSSGATKNSVIDRARVQRLFRPDQTPSSHAAASFVSSFTLLFLWTIPPVIALSFSSSRLPWYIAPSYPGIALLFAGACSLLLALCAHRSRLVAGLSLLALLLPCLSIGQQLYRHASGILQSEERIAFDRMHQGLLPSLTADDVPLQVLPYHMPAPAQREKPYFRAIYPDYLSTPSVESNTVRGALRLRMLHPSTKPQPLLVLTDTAHFLEVFNYQIPSYYARLAKFAERNESMYALLYSTEASVEHFNSTKHLLDLGSSDTRVAFGWSHSGSFNSLSIRNTTAPDSGILLDADWLFSTRPVRAYLNIAVQTSSDSQVPPIAADRRVRVFINSTEVATIEAHLNNLQTYDFAIAPGVFAEGTNLIQLRTTDTVRIMGNWMSFQLR